MDAFLKEHLLFRDPKMKKYFDRNLQRDLGKFRTQARTKHSTKSFEKFMYVLITDSIRDIILQTVGEITEHMKDMGDLVISGGEAFNIYTAYDDRIVTSDIDAKFVPRMSVDPKFFGKLQATKLILWDKLGQVAQKLNLRIKKRMMAMRKKYPKIFKFLGVNFDAKGPHVTRRYILIKKKKTRPDNKPSKDDVFIDVELFALDLNIKFLSTKTGKVENTTIGGILDIPFMRPNEFGYEVVLSRRRGVTYRNPETGKSVRNNKIFVASKEFLIEDIYLMHKLKLRPEKKEKDRQRLLKLSKLFVKTVNPSDSIETLFRRVHSKIVRKKPVTRKNGKVSMTRAAKINPYKYNSYTTKPSDERLSKQFVHGLKSTLNNVKVNGYENSSGNKRFNAKSLKWKNVTNNSYVKNEMNLRTKNAKKIPKRLNVSKTLYGYKPRRNKWVPNSVLDKAAAIPFVGLKK
jgi:hypothetical protein